MAVVTSNLPTGVQDQNAVAAAKIFSQIYKNKMWVENNTTDSPFYSGTGSHDSDMVGTYIRAVRLFLTKNFSKSPDMVDIGCGDFNVGKQIRDLTGKYVACDVVPDLIDHNRLVHSDKNIEFQVLDMLSEDLPAGDIVCIRQVLQHHSNDNILRLLPKLRNYKWLIFTDHIPLNEDFVPNVDFETGYLQRIVTSNSGVVLTEAPFNMAYHKKLILCDAPALAYGRMGHIRTIAYQLQQD